MEIVGDTSVTLALVEASVSVTRVILVTGFGELVVGFVDVVVVEGEDGLVVAADVVCSAGVVEVDESGGFVAVGVSGEDPAPAFGVGVVGVTMVIAKNPSFPSVDEDCCCDGVVS